MQAHLFSNTKKWYISCIELGDRLVDLNILPPAGGYGKKEK